RMSATQGMIQPAPLSLDGFGVSLIPLQREHAPSLERAAADGKLWMLRVTSVPEPGAASAYINAALEGQKAGHMLPFAVFEKGSGDLIGTTRYHDIIAPIGRLEIGYTWYASTWQR